MLSKWITFSLLSRRTMHRTSVESVLSQEITRHCRWRLLAAQAKHSAHLNTKLTLSAGHWKFSRAQGTNPNSRHTREVARLKKKSKSFLQGCVKQTSDRKLFHSRGIRFPKVSEFVEYPRHSITKTGVSAQRILQGRKIARLRNLRRVSLKRPARKLRLTFSSWEEKEEASARYYGTWKKRKDPSSRSVEGGPSFRAGSANTPPRLAYTWATDPDPTKFNQERYSSGSSMHFPELCAVYAFFRNVPETSTSHFDTFFLLFDQQWIIPNGTK